jgi:L-amino acid N-acyltransferase YncA
MCVSRIGSRTSPFLRLNLGSHSLGRGAALAGDQRSAGSGYEIALAMRGDISGILELQVANLRENGGTLSVRFPRDWFEAALDDLPVIVARKGGRVVGYLVSSSKAAQSHAPIIKAMLDAYPGEADADLYGPICIAGTERGQNLPAVLMADLGARLPGREGITFIRRDNAASLRAHAKIGMREVAEFVHDGSTVVVVAWRG